MTLITVQAGTVEVNFEAGDINDPIIRIYNRKTFVPSSGETVLGNRYRGPTVYEEVDCSFEAGVVSYNQFVLDSTEDAISDPYFTTYSFALYADNGSTYIGLIHKRIRVPVTTPTTLADLVEFSVGYTPPGTSLPTAEQITYDNTNTGMLAEQVQAAIDELFVLLEDNDALEVLYDNTVSGLLGDNVQEAIDELAAIIPGGSSVWGAITGTLSDQADLLAALNALTAAIGTKQATLVNETNLRSINGKNLVGAGQALIEADDVPFDPTGSPLTSTDLQAAVVEAAEQIPTFLMRFYRPEYEVVAADVDPVADTITLSGHRMSTGTAGAWDTTWGGFTVSVQIYVIRVDENTVKFASTLANARAGVAMDITADPGGTVVFTSTNGHHIYAGRIHRTATEMTHSFGDSAVDPAADTITFAEKHDFGVAHGIQFNSSWGGLVTGTLYYVIPVDDYTIKVASSYANAVAGTAFDITADPGGTVSCFGVYGDFYYDAFVAPALNAEYPISVGYGGAHIMLFGFDGGAAGRIALTGNMSTATGGAIDQGLNSGNDQAVIDHPVHIAVGRFQNVVTVYMNGVPCKRFTKLTGRGANDFSSDAPTYIAGSDHSNYQGDIYWVRIFENHCPFYAGSTGGCIRVSPRPRTTYYESVTAKFITANLLYNFSQPATTIANLGTPLVKGRTNHGIRSAGTDGENFADFASYEEHELPQQVRAPLPERPDFGFTPTAPPVGAKIFDSFKRNDITYTWMNFLGLGETEGGSLGVKRWKQTVPSAPRHGILFGRAYVDGIGADTTREFVDNDTAFMKVEIENNGNETIGAVLFAAYDFTTDTGIKAVHGDLDTIALFKVAAGVETGLGTFIIAGDNVPYTLGIDYTSTKHIKLLINGVAEIDHDDSANPALTGISAGFTAKVGFCRFEDFAVYAASA